MEDNNLITQLADWATKLSDEELHRALEFLGGEYRRRMERAAHRAALALRPGDWVEVVKSSRKLPAGARGRVTEIRGGDVKVRFADHGDWKVTAPLVRKTDGPK